MMVGIGVGAAVLIGEAIAIGSNSGGGDGGDNNTPAPVTPPTSDQLVSSWNADGVQPGSGWTYYGTVSAVSGGIFGL